MDKSLVVLLVTYDIYIQTISMIEKQTEIADLRYATY